MHSKTLYDSALTAVASNLSPKSLYSHYLPADVRVDIILKLYEIGNDDLLAVELKRYDNMVMLLQAKYIRMKLHKVFQHLMDKRINMAMYYSDVLRLNKDIQLKHTYDKTLNDELVAFTLSLGDFLTEAGWFSHAEQAYTTALTLIQRCSDEESIKRALDCCGKLLRVQNGNCCYDKACAMVECVVDILNELPTDARNQYNKACIYIEIAVLLFAKSNYEQAFRHSHFALRELGKADTSLCTVVDVLRLCSKACVVKREFKVAGKLIKHAVTIASEYYGETHPKYADTLIDYGFYLLNVDQIVSSVSVYEKALAIREEVFGGDNLHVAIANEDLAYAYYVHEYNSGDFKQAISHAVKAIKILMKILPHYHLLLASSKRVKALVLEEVAIDSQSSSERNELLEEALSLHKESLALAKLAFGENNVQTAKHYGNLGRLYQTMHLWDQAEEMHQKAIKIKEELLGLEDYEVALSVGHLASLYNYDMKKYTEAETLYQRSIDISIKLFGEGYSGLEYDYRGLIRLYNETSNAEKALIYIDRLSSWCVIRDNQEEALTDPLDFKQQESKSMSTSYQCLLEQSESLHPNISDALSLLDVPLLCYNWHSPQPTSASNSTTDSAFMSMDEDFIASNSRPETPS